MEMNTAASLRLGKANSGSSFGQKLECIANMDSALISQVINSSSGSNPGFRSDYSVEKDHGELHNAIITVVTRTQGNRPDLLQETFLCLSAQTDRRFRVVLIEHKVDVSGKERIRELVNELPGWLQERITIIATESGGRSHPLNIGFMIADTDYAVILDDDDLVFDDWIKSFTDGIESNRGSIIHAGTYTQKWEKGGSEKGDYYRAVESPFPGYCDSFDYLKQLNCNYCPTMGLAYPLFVFKVFGICFDESLSTVEDWDYLMRAARICGVHDVEQRTAIYRLWLCGENSHALHDEAEWETNRQLVQEKLDQLPMVFPSGYYRKISEKFDVFQDVRFDANDVRVFAIGRSGSAREIEHVRAAYSMSSQINSIDFKLEGAEAKVIGIDLRSTGRMTLSDFKMVVCCSNGNQLVFDSYDLCGNYYCCPGGKMGFVASSPHLKVVLPSLTKVESCHVSFKYRNYVEETLLTGTKLRLRVERKARRAMRRLKGRIG